MKSNELLRQVLKKKGFKNVASESGLALSCLYKWCEPDCGKASGTVNPLERTALLIAITKDPRLAQWVCECAGGYFVPNPPLKGPRIDEESWREVLRTVLTFHCALLGTFTKGAMSREAVEELRRTWETLKTEMEWYVSGCERSGVASQPAQVAFAG